MIFINSEEKCGELGSGKFMGMEGYWAELYATTF